MKTCRKCGEDKSLAEYGKHATTKDRLQTWCKGCRSDWVRRDRRENPTKWLEYNRRYKERNHERVLERRRVRYRADPKTGARKRLEARLRREFGLSIEDYDALVCGPCAICGETGKADDNRAGIVLDHCHKTNKVRGVLCQLCNTGLGKFADDPACLRAAADYLEIHRTS